MVVARELPKHVSMSHKQEILGTIKNPGCNLAVWLRDQGQLTREAIQWLSGLTEIQIPDKRLYVTRDRMPDEIRKECERTMPEGGERDEIIEDIISRTDEMFAFTGELILKVRLDRVNGAMCTRFHQDAVGVRMLCTYKGLGTEWVPNDAVREDEMNQGLPNEQVVPDRSMTQHLPRFAVGYLKGSNAEDGSFGIVHRSPDFTPRMLLCVEPIDKDVFDGNFVEI